MSKASGNTRTKDANMALDGGVKKQIYDYYEEVFNKNVKSMTKELNDIKTLSDKQRKILTNRVQAYQKNNLRGTEKGLQKRLNEYAKKYGRIKDLKKSLFLEDIIEGYAVERAFRSMIPQIEKKLKQ